MINNIRNFSIIAHIDHGKSTLADRILEMTGAIRPEDMREQVLDDMDLERERGITIKAKAVRIKYKSKDGSEYILNLIDTPGHVDFTYEVSRSLTACEGTLLLVDASQGVEAQTLSNLFLAQENNLKIIPIVNKIDLDSAETDKVRKQITELMPAELKDEDIILTSAKLGKGIDEVLEAIVDRVPPPKGQADGPLSCLIFDSVFDAYRGVVIYSRVFNGAIHQGKRIRMFHTGGVFEVTEVGTFSPNMVPGDKLTAGEVGYFIAGIKDIHAVKIGDTVVDEKDRGAKSARGFREVKPYVFYGLYPVESQDYERLRSALDKLSLNDASFDFIPEDSAALGYGFRCGFLGALHMEIVKERLEREYGLELLITSPNVIYQVKVKDDQKDTIYINNPSELPDVSKIDEIFEPYVRIIIITPASYIGPIMTLVKEERRGIFQSMNYIDPQRVVLVYEMPFVEMVVDFYDKLKSVSKGFATLDYKHIGYRKGNLVKLEILISGRIIDAFSFIVPKNRATTIGRNIVNKLRKLIPRQLFAIPIQAQINNRIIARETVSPLRKDVIAKCYGGDVTRKRKLLERQKEGKKKMKHLGRVEVPKDVFISVLKAE